MDGRVSHIQLDPTNVTSHGSKNVGTKPTSNRDNPALSSQRVWGKVSKSISPSLVRIHITGSSVGSIGERVAWRPDKVRAGGNHQWSAEGILSKLRVFGGPDA